MSDETIIFGSPLIEEAEMREVQAVLESGWLGTGPRVHQLEKMFREYKGVNHALAVHSCTAALHLSMLSAGIGNADEVLVPTMTFAATSNAVIHAGARPVFVDCLRDTMNIDPEDVERKVTTRTRAIIPVHFAGRPCDMDAIMAIAQKHDLIVIEDCAHAIETEYKGKKAGTFGDIGCFSFYVTKNIVTGEGGMVITDREDIANDIKVRCLHGLSKDAWWRFGDEGYKHYQVVSAGYKYNMMDLQAAIGIHQLPRIDRYWRRRKAIWDRYNQSFQELPAFTPAAPEPGTRHALHLYTLLIDIDSVDMTRDQFMAEMTRHKTGVGVHYIAVHLHPYYHETYHYQRGDFPNAEWISDRTVSLPLSPKLTDEQVDRIINTVCDILKK